MLQDRIDFILQELEEKGSVRVADLGKQLNCSEVTIRNDIQKLEEKGLLFRTHGGATKLGAQVVVSYNAGNVYKYADKKQKIAEKAYQYIADHDTIIMDDSSISYYLAKSIKENTAKHIVVITNSLLAAGILADVNHIDLFFLGGQVGGKLAATMGDITIRNLEYCHADKAFISAHGINFEAGITSIDSPQMQVKKAILKAAKDIYLLADSHKFGGGYVLAVCPLSRISRIITDNELDQEYIDRAKQDNVNLEIV